MKNKNWVSFILVSLLLSMSFFIYLANHYYKVNFGLDHSEAICNVNSYISCDNASLSSFSSVLGIPLALWGLAVNLILAGLTVTLLLEWSDNSDSLTGLLMTGLLFNASASIVMLFISLLVVKSLCLFCFAAYITSFLALAGGLKGFNDGLGKMNSFFKKIGQQAVLVLSLVAGGSVVAWASHNGFLETYQSQSQLASDQSLQEKIQRNISDWQSKQAYKFSDKGLRYSKGPNPQFLLVEFADFRCSHCKDAVKPIHTFLEAHPDVEILFKPFPLDGTCNPAPVFQGKGDGISCGLAAIVMCTEKLQSAGWKAHELIFDRQIEFSQRSIEESSKVISSELKIDLAKLNECRQSANTIEEVKLMAQEGVTAQIRGTPSVFMGGRQLEGGAQPLLLKEALDVLKKPAL